MRVTHLGPGTVLLTGVLFGAPASAGEVVVGSWNIEVLHEEKTRGFPELKGGNALPPREDADYKLIARSIKKTGAKILVLEEINAKQVTIQDGEDEYEDTRSKELEKVLKHLPDTWDYTIGESGGYQHVAIMYDTSAVQLNAACEADFPREKVQKKGLFDRQPLFAHFTFLENGTEKNDLVVVGVHLASGQKNAWNHTLAMRKLRKMLWEARQEEWCIPKGEHDILITGDFNASMYDKHKGKAYVEGDDFWAHKWWQTLAPENGADYPGTRVNGSQIDYVMVSKGLLEEVVYNTAKVWDELAPNKKKFRKQQSDHIPVTVRIKVGTDGD